MEGMLPLKRILTDDEMSRLRDLHYSSLLQQRQENATNRIKIALISIGATIAGIVGSIKGIQTLSIPYLLLVIFFVGYAPWIYMLYVICSIQEIRNRHRRY